MQPKATIFEFTSYTFEPDKKRILFSYKTVFNGQDPLVFTETITLPKIPNLQGLPKEVIKKLLESLHLMLGISYYKFYCPPLIKFGNESEVSPKADATKVTTPYKLSKKEADFWNTIYKKGLGEFFYVNKLNPNNSPKFPYHKNVKEVSCSLGKNNKCLVGMGGGKDSIVAAQLLKEGKFDIEAFVVATNKESPLVKKIIKTANIKSLTIGRRLDKKVFQQHQYNGHIPISAIYAFLGVLSAVLYRYSYVIMGNEHSSNFGNLTYKGLEINHQWSKSFEFETLFQDYIKNSVTGDVFYFSLLRSFYEIRIVKLFSRQRKYFPYFSSCNKNFTLVGNKNNTLWCGQCAKCVFVFTLLSAFLEKKTLLSIFKKNLYQDQSLLPSFKDILGMGAAKPFDCVGTFQEAQTALVLAGKNFKDDFIVRHLANKAVYHKEVFNTNKNSCIPEAFKFLGMESALIMGFGKEGEISKKYLKKIYPKLRIGIADQKEGSGYLEKQKEFDMAIKTPGIKKELVTIPYTTATNTFFSKTKGKHTIIGVTGSKGKSTTSTLIYGILKQAHKPVELLGNIGKPMLQALLKPIKKDTVFVLELSSAQLDDLVFSPDIAVVTNLFPEHMDYHGNVKNYYQAKQNIIRFQNKNDYVIYNPKNKLSLGWLKNYQGKPIPFAKDIPVKDSDIPLLGEHNKDNIKAAICVAKLFNIPDAVIKNTIIKFKGLPHRLEFIGNYQGILFYDDAISTTPDSTIMAIKAIPNIGTIFLGGTDRGYDFTPLEKTIKKYNIKNIVLFPESGTRMLKNTEGLNILKTNSMEQAVLFAYRHTKPGQVCLLSCASPSYSLWKNFEQKGNIFKKSVKKLSKL